MSVVEGIVKAEVMSEPSPLTWLQQHCDSHLSDIEENTVWLIFSMGFCCREQLVNNIAEQERLGRLLREDQKSVKDLVQTSAKQLGMWRDVVKYVDDASLQDLPQYGPTLSFQFYFIPCSITVTSDSN